MNIFSQKKEKNQGEYINLKLNLIDVKYGHDMTKKYHF